MARHAYAGRRNTVLAPGARRAKALHRPRGGRRARRPRRHGHAPHRRRDLPEARLSMAAACPSSPSTPATRASRASTSAARGGARCWTPVTEAHKLGATGRPCPTGTIAKGSNVAGIPVELCALRGLRQPRSRPVLKVTSQAEQLGVKSGYRDLGQLGTDRWPRSSRRTGLRGPQARRERRHRPHGRRALRGDGFSLGGLIVPGPALMRASLTDRHRGLEAHRGPVRPVPALDARRHHHRGRPRPWAPSNAWPPRWRRRTRRRSARPVGRGRLDLEPHLSSPVTLNDNLVLDGVALIARAGR